MNEQGTFRGIRDIIAIMPTQNTKYSEYNPIGLLRISFDISNPNHRNAMYGISSDIELCYAQTDSVELHKESQLLRWNWTNHTIVPVPVKQSLGIYEQWCPPIITHNKKDTTNLYISFLVYTSSYMCYMYVFI